MPKTHLGIGTTLGYDLTGVGTTFVTLGNLVSVDGPNSTVEPIETTNLATTGGKTYRSSLLFDGGDIGFTVQLDPQDTGHQAIVALIDTPPTTLPAFQITFSDGTKYGAHGILTAFAPKNMTTDGLITADASIKISGNFTRTVGTGS